jgi:hypothetical protein
MRDVSAVMYIHNQAARKAARAARVQDNVTQNMWKYVMQLAADHMNRVQQVEIERKWYSIRRNARLEKVLEESLQWLSEAYSMTLECDPNEPRRMDR